MIFVKKVFLALLFTAVSTASSAIKLNNNQIDDYITTILTDGEISADEVNMLAGYCRRFISHTEYYLNLSEAERTLCTDTTKEDGSALTSQEINEKSTLCKSLLNELTQRFIIG